MDPRRQPIYFFGVAQLAHRPKKPDSWNLLGSKVFSGDFSGLNFFFLRKIKSPWLKHAQLKDLLQTVFQVGGVLWTVLQTFILDCGHGKNSFWGPMGFLSAIPRVATGKHWRADRAVVPHNVEVNSRCRTFMALDLKRVKQHLCFLLTVEIHANLYCCFVPLHVGIFKKSLYWVSDSQPPAKGNAGWCLCSFPPLYPVAAITSAHVLIYKSASERLDDF